MNDFLQMNIFFAVTTMAVFFFGVMGMIALYYMIRILRNIEHVSRNVSSESDNIREDVRILRSKAREEGIRITHLMDFFLGMKERRRASSKKEKVEK